MGLKKLLFFSFASAFIFVLKGANGVEEAETCPYDYNVIQRVGKSDYMTGQPIKIIDQSTTTVKFTVGNTWTKDENDVVCSVQACSQNACSRTRMNFVFGRLNACSSVFVSKCVFEYV